MNKLIIIIDVMIFIVLCVLNGVIGYMIGVNFPIERYFNVLWFIMVIIVGLGILMILSKISTVFGQKYKKHMSDEWIRKHNINKVGGNK